MAHDVTNGIGGSGSAGIANASANEHALTTDHKTAMVCKVWNTHATQTLYASVNTTYDGVGMPIHEAASAVSIPAGGSFTFVSRNMPIRSLTVTGSGASTTYNYGAY